MEKPKRRKLVWSSFKLLGLLGFDFGEFGGLEGLLPKNRLDLLIGFLAFYFAFAIFAAKSNFAASNFDSRFRIQVTA